VKKVKDIVFWLMLIFSWVLIYLSWDLNQKRVEAWEWAVRFNELSTRAGALSLAWGDFHLQKIDIDSLATVKDYYGTYLRETTELWQEVKR